MCLHAFRSYIKRNLVVTTKENEDIQFPSQSYSSTVQFMKSELVPGIQQPPLVMIKVMTQSEGILGTRFSIIHACPMQSERKITSIGLQSALPQMMKTREGGREGGRL